MMRVSYALVLLIVFEIVVLFTALAFDQPLLAAVVVGAGVVVGILLFVTSDFFFEHWERWRERGR
jgi:hypothetical protein